MKRSTASRIICGVLAVSFIGTAIFASCSEGANSGEKQATTEVGTNGDITEVLPSYREDINGTTNIPSIEKDSATSSEGSTRTTSSPTYFTDKELAVKGAVDNALTAYLHGDIDGVMEYSDMEIMYYMAYKQRADKETMLKALSENGEDFFSGIQDNDVKWEVKSVSPISDEKYSDMKDYLYNKYGETYGEPYFSEVEKAFNITDIYVAAVGVDYSDSEEMQSGADAGLSSTSLFYVFGYEDKWVLDTAYSTAYSMQRAIDYQKQQQEQETTTSAETYEGYTIERRESKDEE